MRKNNRTVRVLKEPKTDSSIRKVYIPSSVAILLAELREEQNETIEALGDMYENYNLVMATSYGLPLGESYLRVKMQEVIDREGLPDVVFHSLRHTSVTYKLKLSGGDIKAVQGDSGHAQADMVTINGANFSIFIVVSFHCIDRVNIVCIKSRTKTG